MTTKPEKIDRRKQISPQLKAALDSMVEEGLQFDAAAVKQKMTVRAMRLALKRPNVIKYLREARQVFLAHVGASNIRRLRELRDQDENKAAAVKAIQVLEALEEEVVRPGAGQQRTPGLIVVVNAGGISAPAPAVTLDATVPPPASPHAFGIKPASQPLLTDVPSALNVTERKRT